MDPIIGSSNPNSDISTDSQKRKPKGFLLLGVVIVLTIILGLIIRWLPDRNIPIQNQTAASEVVPVESSSEALDSPLEARDFLRVVVTQEDFSEDYVLISGEVENKGVKPLTFIQLQVSVFTRNGEWINTSTGYIDQIRLESLQTSPFKIYIHTRGKKAASYKVTVENAFFAVP